MKKNVLFINGVADNHKVKVRKIERNSHIQWMMNGSAHVGKYLENHLFHRSKILLDTTSDQEFPRQIIHGIFNEISDPDTHKIALQKAEDFYKSVCTHIPFFNIPSRVMQTTRDTIYRLLQGIDKLHVPKTVKIQPKSPADIYDTIKQEGFEFPVIFRQAGDHGGISTIRIDDETEQFYAFALDGREYYLTQFVEYAQNGMYASYRLVVVDGEVFIRHVIFGTEWMVHTETHMDKRKTKTAKLQNDIAKQFTSEIKPKIQPMVTEIYKRLGLDYFCMDCFIDKEMNLLVFEINVNIVFFDQTAENIFSKHIEKIREALIKMIDSKTSL